MAGVGMPASTGDTFAIRQEESILVLFMQPISLAAKFALTQDAPACAAAAVVVVVAVS